MTIEEAKTEIRRTVSIYLKKDEFGSYRIPVEKQRPIFMIGAPGIGKTAVMEQLAEEMDLCLVTYSMTHHTRQSAVGLPFIVHRTYEGMEADVSLYTMSEIIASIYESMEKSGKREGILFLDEINCVSETLAPSMLQFLQYKTFGNHRVPDGWVIVTAGNPPEYNRSVREFDVVTLDRMKLLEIDPDYDAWSRYAANRGIHKAVRTYLEVRKDDFYGIESSNSGKSYVTARGWEDLASAISLYEEMSYPVDLSLISQYLRNRRIAAEFATFYELFAKYRSDYGIPEILEGRQSPEIEERAKKAGFDERLTVTELLLDAVISEAKHCAEKEQFVRTVHPELLSIRDKAVSPEHVAGELSDMRDNACDNMRRRQNANALSASEKRIYLYYVSFAEAALRRIRLSGSQDMKGQEAFQCVKTLFEEQVSSMMRESAESEKHLKNMFLFIENVFGNGNEMLVAVTDLSLCEDIAVFLSDHAPDEYFRYQKRFMLHERGLELQKMLGGDVMS